MDDAFIRSPKEILDFFQVDIDKGLTQKQVEESEKNYGRNGTHLYYFVLNLHDNYIYISKFKKATSDELICFLYSNENF